MPDQSLNPSTNKGRQTQEITDLDELRLRSSTAAEIDSASNDLFADANLAKTDVKRQPDNVPDHATRARRASTPTLQTTASTDKSVRRPDTAGKPSAKSKAVPAAPVYSGTVLDRLVTFAAYLLKKLEVALLNFLENLSFKKEKVIKMKPLDVSDNRPSHHDRIRKKKEFDEAVIIKRE